MLNPLLALGRGRLGTICLRLRPDRIPRGLSIFCFLHLRLLKLVGRNRVDDLDSLLGGWHWVTVSVEFIVVLEILLAVVAHVAFVLVLLAEIIRKLLIIKSSLWTLHEDGHAVTARKEGPALPGMNLLAIDLQRNIAGAEVAHHVGKLGHLLSELLILCWLLAITLHLLRNAIDGEVNLRSVVAGVDRRLLAWSGNARLRAAGLLLFVNDAVTAPLQLLFSSELLILPHQCFFILFAAIAAIGL